MTPNVLSALSVAFLGVIASARAQTTVIYVNAAAPPGGLGQSWSTAYRDLQDALGHAGPAQIWVAAGSYKPDRGTADPTETFQVPAGIEIYGGFFGTETHLVQRDFVANEVILSGDLFGNDGSAFQNYADNSGRVVTLGGAGARLDGVTVRGGGSIGVDLHFGLVTNCLLTKNLSTGTSSGGAVRTQVGGSAEITSSRFLQNRSEGSGAAVRGAALITDCCFEQNHAVQSGGACFGEGSVITGCEFVQNSVGPGGEGGAAWGKSLFQNCTFTQNSAPGGRGGAVRFTGGNSDHETIFRDCEFTENFALEGGALYIAPSSLGPLLRTCRFEQNSATRGGALYAGNCRAQVLSPVFIGNTALQGGAVYFTNANPSTLLNARFLGNTAAVTGLTNAFGGAIFINNTALSATGCEFSGNQAGDVGGAIAGQFLQSLTLTNCTFALNHAPVGGGLYIAGTTGPGVRNSILWENSDASGNGLAAQFAGSATPSFSYSSIAGWTGALPGLGNDGSNPLLADADGPDNVIGTVDDDLSLTRPSASIDSGSVALLPPDTFDLDGDSNFNEPHPVDVRGQPRFINDPATPNTGVGSPPVDRGASEVNPPACYANCDQSQIEPVLNVADFSCFLGRFAAGDPYANCDGSTTPPVLNVADFTCFLQAFAGACQ